MTDKGKNLLVELNKYICSETKVPPCSISIGKWDEKSHEKAQQVDSDRST